MVNNVNLHNILPYTEIIQSQLKIDEVPLYDRILKCKLNTKGLLNPAGMIELDVNI